MLLLQRQRMGSNPMPNPVRFHTQLGLTEGNITANGTVFSGWNAINKRESPPALQLLLHRLFARSHCLIELWVCYVCGFPSDKKMSWTEGLP